MASKENIQNYYNRYLNNEITKEELEEFLQLIHSPEHELTVSALMDGTWQEMFENTEAVVVPMHKQKWYRIAAAVAILIVVSVSSYFIFKDRKGQDIAQVPPVLKNDIPAPVKNRASVVLADGTVIALDSVNAGTLALQGNMKLVKNANGEIVYQSTASGEPTTLQYNTLFNPRGSKAISITLGDGTQVWLNAESSLKYPTNFSGVERKVEITGEAYFEVAHNTSMPFKVVKGDAAITVLGTHFNVNAYDDELAIKVTLLKGSVKFGTSRQSVMIRPGEQTALTANGQLTTSNNIDLTEVMAWKNGNFKFTNADMQTVMRQVARWYDLTVSYEHGIPDGHYRGTVPRDVSVQKMLEIIKNSGVKFRIEEKELIIE